MAWFDGWHPHKPLEETRQKNLILFLSVELNFRQGKVESKVTYTTAHTSKKAAQLLSKNKVKLQSDR